MRNPFKSEEAAFRFLMGVIGYFAIIAIASVINKWAGLAVFLLMTGGLVTWWLMSRGTPEEPVPTVAPPHPSDEKRVLVIANETVAGPELLAKLKQHARGRKTRVLVVTPALNTKLKHWVSDEDGARASAAERLQASLESMRAAGMKAEGEVGDPDPLQAIDDAVRTFSPDDIIISTHPEGRSNWLEQGVVEGARERFDVPVTHVVVDLEAAPAAEPAETS
jgi:nucleotide-binding universal stress UspA family protein